MGIAQALYSGVTGLSVNADGMSVTANNIANANAKGFKKDRAEFEDMLSMTLSGGSNDPQIGRGSRLAGVKTIHTQGGLKVTENMTDLAIQGQGFFVVSNPKTQESAGKLYSRVGNLHFDKDGYFATASGGRVQGYLANNSGNITSRLTDIRIETSGIPPRATEAVNLNVQLDSRADIINESFDPLRFDETSNFSTTVSVFDSQGYAHQMTVFFRKVSGGEEGSEWEWYSGVDNKEVSDPDSGNYKIFGNGSIKFNKYGVLLEENTNESSVNFTKGAFSGQEIKIDFGKNIGVDAGTGVGSSSSIATNSVTSFHTQDGYEAGQIKSIDIGLDGVITGVFTNGVDRKLAAISLATFSNENALVKVGQNMFAANADSGPPNVGYPETGTRGSLYASSLEESNVDLASEFVDMILTQRLFQANSRSITTSDAMIEEVVNLKR